MIQVAAPQVIHPLCTHNFGCAPELEYVNQLPWVDDCTKVAGVVSVYGTRIALIIRDCHPFGVQHINQIALKGNRVVLAILPLSPSLCLQDARGCNVQIIRKAQVKTICRSLYALEGIPDSVLDINKALSIRLPCQIQPTNACNDVFSVEFSITVYPSSPGSLSLVAADLLTEKSKPLDSATLFTQLDLTHQSSPMNRIQSSFYCM